MLYFPNPALSARKNDWFSHIFPRFPSRTHQQVFTAYLRSIYQVKADKMIYSIKKELGRYYIFLHLWITLTLYTFPKFDGKLGKSWGDTACWMEICGFIGLIIFSQYEYLTGVMVQKLTTICNEMLWRHDKMCISISSSLIVYDFTGISHLGFWSFCKGCWCMIWNGSGIHQIVY